MAKKIMVTGIGGIVGQGILRNIINIGENIALVGTNTDPVSAGNHFCDRVYQVPLARQEGYNDRIKKICQKEKIDLIIPSTDDETYYLALNKDELPLLACADAKVSEIFLNKYKTWQFCKEHNIPFAETTLPSHYKNEFSEILIKPAEGRGSRNIHVNPEDHSSFSDDYVIQKFYRGKEITTAFYITRESSLLGQITMERELVSGYTQKCQVVFDYDQQINAIISKINQHLNLKCSYNIQSIVTQDGEIIPFEINGRISGTNSIRSQLGFKDVQFIIDEYIYNKPVQKPKILPGSSMRILLDIIFPEVGLKEIKNRNTRHFIYYK